MVGGIFGRLLVGVGLGGWEVKILSMKIMKIDEVFDFINCGELVDNIVLFDLNSKRLSIREVL